MGTTRVSLPFRGVKLSPSTEVELRTHLEGVLSATYPGGVTMKHAVTSDILIPIWFISPPVAADGRTPAGESIVVVGKDLSEHGISFYHPEVISHRRMIASLEMGNGCWLGVLVDLRWCRFTKAGWYESGGRFLDVVESPMKQAG